MSNSFACVGRLGNDAEVKKSQSGSAYASFRIANDTGFGDRKKTQWIRCLIFGKRAESGLIDYLKKGQQVFVCGELQVETNESDSGKVYVNIDLRVQEVSLVGSRQKDETHGQTGGKPKASDKDEFGDDIPF